MLDIETKINNSIIDKKKIVFDKMPRHDELTRAAKTTDKVLTFGPRPRFDQCAEYVYESALYVAGEELRIVTTVAPVTNVDDGRMRFKVIAGKSIGDAGMQV